jgi:hypothetical protein
LGRLAFGAFGLGGVRILALGGVRAKLELGGPADGKDAEELLEKAAAEKRTSELRFHNG